MLDSIEETIHSSSADKAVAPPDGGQDNYSEVKCLRERVSDYFAELPPDTPRPVRQVEEDLDLPYRKLGAVMNAMAEDPECPLYKTPAKYTGKLQYRRELYKGFAWKAQSL